jgi:hypothetical protein
VEDGPPRVDDEPCLGFSEQLSVRVSDARSVPDREEGVEDGAAGVQDLLDVLGTGAEVLELGVVCPELLEQGDHGVIPLVGGEIPAPGTKLRNKVCATVAAFANGDGGHILFGVADGGAIVGLSGVDIQKECDTVAQFVSSTVTPVPHFRVARVSEEGNDGSALDVIVLTVDQGDQPPYGVDPAHPKYYVRRGATTFEASSDQVRALARSRPPADQAYQSPYGLRFL